jgi:dipeptidyl aminopeptidase/acylaminoacyl peptidase
MPTYRSRSSLCTLALLASWPLLIDAQPARTAPPTNRLTYADYLDWEDVQSPELSPDGKQIIYTRRWIDKLNDRWESSLWIMQADGSRPRFLTKGGNARWSPDGTRIAFIAPGEPSGAQVWVRYMDAEGATSQVTRLSDGPADISWSPDGKSIAFRMLVQQRETWSIPMPAMPRGAKWTETPRVVTKVDYRSDREGFTDEGFRQLFVVPADGGTPRQLTTGGWETGPARWMPDGSALVFSSLRRPDAEYAWRESEVYRVPVAGGEITALTSRKGPDNNPVPSPNGQLIAYTGYDSTDATWKDAILYVMNADGSGPRALTTSFDRSPQGVMWASDGSGLYFNAESDGARNLYFVSLAGQVRAITKGAQVLSVADIHPSGLAVGTASTARESNDIVSFNLRTPATMSRLTAVNADVLAGKQLATTEEVWYTSVDGMKIQGWIVKPADFDPSRKYPLMLEIHGGPHSMYNVAFNIARQDHAAHGYVVLYTNPRGSTGYGSAFGNAIKNAYPGKDFDDLMAGVDTVIGRGYVDTKRLYVFGCSGGGVLTSWIVGHTTRFAAASANCPVTNWLSFVGTTDGPSWYRNFAKFPWDDPSEHLRRSPLMYVGNVKTPTMLMTGVLDLRTPMPQTEEYYQALKMMKVPTAMIRFNNEWHGTSSTPSNWLRTQLYLRSWFEKWQGPAGTPATTTMQQMDGAR